MSDQNLTQAPAKPIPAPDPSAHIESDSTPETDGHQTTDQSLIKRLGIPTNFQELTSFGPKHYLAKIVSVVLILHGLTNLYEQTHELLFIFPRIPEIYKALNFSSEIYQSLLYRSIVTTASGLINTVYGIALAFKHSSVVEYAHLVAGIALFAISYYLLSQVPPLEIDKLTQQGLAYLSQF